nr:hypothetical protein [Roseomonas gilardii]
MAIADLVVQQRGELCRIAVLDGGPQRLQRGGHGFRVVLGGKGNVIIQNGPQGLLLTPDPSVPKDRRFRLTVAASASSSGPGRAASWR